MRLGNVSPGLYRHRMQPDLEDLHPLGQLAPLGRSIIVVPAWWATQYDPDANEPDGQAAAPLLIVGMALLYGTQ